MPAPQGAMQCPDIGSLLRAGANLITWIKDVTSTTPFTARASAMNRSTFNEQDGRTLIEVRHHSMISLRSFWESAWY